MEPLRCFSEFMRAIPYIVEDNKKIRIVIAGADRVAYSYKAPNENGSWKDYELNNMPEEARSRISFTGLLGWEDYKKLLKRSDIHCYFSEPYVLSWSFIESAACGINIATNMMCGMLEVVEEESVHWMEIKNPTDLAKSIKKAINQKKRAQLSRSFLMRDYLQNWQDAINSTILSMR